MTCTSSGLRCWYSSSRHRADAAAEHDHLRCAIAFGLEQDRIHVDARLDAGGFGLHRLRAPDLAAVGRDDRS